MASSNYGKTVPEMEAILKAHADHVARRHEAARERGDDDECHMGLSAWAEGLNFQLYEAEKNLAAQGWKAEFPALVEATTGAPVQAVRARTRYGTRWALTDAQGNYTGVFFALGERAVCKRGYRTVQVLRPAKAVIAGGGQGLGGCTSCYIDIVEVK